LVHSWGCLLWRVYFRETLWYDLKLSRLSAWALTGLMPLLLFLLGARDIISTVNIVGAVFFGFQVVVILMMHKKSQKSEIQPAYKISLSKPFYYIIGAIAILGAISSL